MDNKSILIKWAQTKHFSALDEPGAALYYSRFMHYQFTILRKLEFKLKSIRKAFCNQLFLFLVRSMARWNCEFLLVLAVILFQLLTMGMLHFISFSLILALSVITSSDLFNCITVYYPTWNSLLITNRRNVTVVQYSIIVC